MFEGRNQSISYGFISAARIVGNSLRYIPAYTLNGKAIPQKLLFVVGVNRRIGKNGMRKDFFPCNIWGNFADVGCKTFSPGKALDIFYTPEMYRGKLYNADGTARMDNLGQPIEVDKFSLRVNDFILGEDSAKQINEEITANPPKRGKLWNVPGTEDNAHFLARTQQRMASTFDKMLPKFGFANVRPVPAGAVVNDAVYTQGVPQAPTQQQLPLSQTIAGVVGQPMVDPQFTQGVPQTPAQTPAAPQYAVAVQQPQGQAQTNTAGLF